jgi:hypothetical protein
MGLTIRNGSHGAFPGRDCFSWFGRCDLFDRIAALEQPKARRGSIAAVVSCASRQRLCRDAAAHVRRVLRELLRSRSAEFCDNYWGDNLARLAAIKQHYDPENLLRHPQSVPVGLPVA